MLQKTIEVSYGELFDKLSILKIKREKIQDEDKLRNINYELTILDEVIGEWSDWHDSTCSLYQELLQTNKEIWEAEDQIRSLDNAVFPLEKHGHMDCLSQELETYLLLAKNIYELNDWRAKVKKQINTLNQSPVVEEKSYHEL
jgi:hypothetical protein